MNINKRALIMRHFTTDLIYNLYNDETYKSAFEITKETLKNIYK